MLPTSFNIKATNLTLTPELRAYVERRFISLAGLIDFHEPTLKVQVEVARTTRHHGKGDIFRAEFNVRRGGGDFRAVAEAPHIHAAIDDARDELETSIGRAKGRRLAFLRRSHRVMKNIVRGAYGAGRRLVRLPTIKMSRFRFKLKLPSFDWRFWKNKK